MRFKPAKRRLLPVAVAVVVVFAFVLATVAPLSVEAVEHWRASEKAVQIALIGTFPHLPSDGEINDAYQAYRAKLPRHGSITQGPTKYHTPWSTELESSNKVILFASFFYASSNKTLHHAVVLNYDFASSKFLFEGVRMAGVKRHAEDQSTSSMLEPEDVISYLQGGWRGEVPNPPDQGDKVPVDNRPLPPPLSKGKQLCVEAVVKYGKKPQTALAYDYHDLQSQFLSAIDRYEAETGSKAYVQENILGTLPALSWLGNQGGTFQAVNKQFVFTSDADRAAHPKGYIPDKDVRPGTELALYNAIFAQRKRTGIKLNPGEVLFLALQQRKGNVKEAFLLAHNVLRSMARMQPATPNSDQELTYIIHQPRFIADNLEPLHLAGAPDEGHNTGSWYHIFGTSYFELQARGTWGLYTLANLGQDGAADEMTHMIDEMNKVLRKDPTLSLPESQSAYSHWANEIEQVAREWIFGSAKDPEKYCFNVWGAQLAAWMYNHRVEKRGVPPIELPKLPEPIVPTAPSILGPIPENIMNGDGRMVISSSPLNITWKSRGSVVMLDQRTQSMAGAGPFVFYPYLEPDKTWGVWWHEFDRKPYVIELEGTADAWAHVSIIGRQGRSVYAFRVAPGSKLAIAMDPVAGPMPVPYGGEILEPVTVGAGALPPRPNPVNPAPRPDDVKRRIVYAQVLDQRTGTPIEGAAFSVLMPGMTTQDWIDRGFNAALVFAKGVTNKEGVVYLDKNLLENTGYAFVVAREGYQPIRYEKLVLTPKMPEPVKITVKMAPR